MKLKLLFAFSVLGLIACQQEPLSLAKKVNPFIGTGGHGHTYPGASSPFGFMQLSPDTRLEGWDGCGGYHYSDSIIYGFSHTHLSGTGISDYGDVLIMPFTGEAHFNNGSQKGVDQGYGSRFNHQDEEAHAGYYKVKLQDYNIEVELSASDRSGMHRYRYAKGNRAAFIIDLEHRDKLLDYKLEILSQKHIRGYRVSKAWAQKQHLYFDLALNHPIENYNYNTDSTKLIIYFNESIDEVLLKAGISTVSMAGAQGNREAEIPHWDFNQLKAETEAKWHRELSKIKVEMNKADEEQIFYSALYHSFLNPNIFQDTDGHYRGMDQKIHQTTDFKPYTVFSLWDTYRATHPLFTISQRKRSLDFIRTFLDHYKKGSKLPMWELSANYTGCMIGYHSVSVIADAYIKGICNFDTALALEAMLNTARADELGKSDWEQKGYMASDEEHESVSKNLEYAYDDWCIAQFAKALGRDSVYAHYLQSAQNYKNLFEPESGFMRAKRNQMFLEPFDPAEVNFNFTEANSWQYSFYVPHDLSGLIKLHGGSKALEKKLDRLFEAQETTSGRNQADITGLIGQYAHGNEPSHHMAYLYNYLKAPSKTQLMVRRILREMYKNSPEGLIGNEDCGQMSSWYVLSALGFYPINPGSTQYSIGSPLVKSARINLENGRSFSIKCKNQSPDHPYIQSIRWNGKAYSKAWIDHAMIMEGGELLFEMGPQPGKPLEAPKQEIEAHCQTPVPYIIQESNSFLDSMVLRLNCVDPEAEIFYRLNSEGPDTGFKLYTDALVLTDNCSLKAYARAPKCSSSKPILASFEKLKTNRSISYSSPPDPQYTGEGDFTLLDGHRGGDDFRTGTWQGWEGQNLSLEIDLGEEGEYLTQIGSSHLQDVNSWIFLPLEVRFYAADKVGNYEYLGSARAAAADTSFGSISETLFVNFPRRKAYKIRLDIQAYGKLPSWHISAGKDSWLFMDEVIFKDHQ